MVGDGKTCAASLAALRMSAALAADSVGMEARQGSVHDSPTPFRGDARSTLNKDNGGQKSQRQPFGCLGQ